MALSVAVLQLPPTVSSEFVYGDIHGSLVKSYHSLPDLVTDADLIVDGVVVASGQRPFGHRSTRNDGSYEILGEFQGKFYVDEADRIGFTGRADTLPLADFEVLRWAQGQPRADVADAVRSLSR